MKNNTTNIEAPVMKPYRRWFFRINALLMFLCAPPMLLWCLNLIDNAAMDYDFAGVGCFAAALVYTFSMVTAIAGLSFAGQPYRYGWCRTLAYIQLIASILLIFLLLPYAALTLPPLFILTILYLFGIGWHKNKDSIQL
ncbi:MAG TPA: hypothetical protein VFC96_06800 [Anaerovoracaceae bacterium]|nr:hypothetical protein [Anaerovoracaceae bacterium]